MTRSPRLPDPSLITDDTPLQLHIAAELAYPDGSMSVSGLRKGISNGTLTAWKMAGRLYTSLGAIRAMEAAIVLREELASAAANRPPTAKELGRRSVYVMQCAEYVKVGIAFDIAKRLGDLNSASPFEVACSYSIEVTEQDAPWIELGVHLALKRYHHRGEWFICDVDAAISQVKIIAELAERKGPRSRRPMHPGNFVSAIP
ncbi:GIY-YIG nuclease family protein [Labrys neptuniae]